LKVWTCLFRNLVIFTGNYDLPNLLAAGGLYFNSQHHARPISRQYITSETWSWSIHNHKEKKLLATKASQALPAKSLNYHYFICFLTSFSSFWQGSTGRLSRIWRHLLRQGLGFSGYQCRSTVKRLVKVHLLGETLIDC
jgi:hypothetical protein